jgi:hypothetical protein
MEGDSVYRCTECGKTHPSFDEAAQCHYGIGGVEVVMTPDEKLDFDHGFNEANS